MNGRTPYKAFVAGLPKPEKPVKIGGGKEAESSLDLQSRNRGNCQVITVTVHNTLSAYDSTHHWEYTIP